MSKSMQLLCAVCGATVLIALAYTGGKLLGAGLAEREIAAAEQGQS